MASSKSSKARRSTGASSKPEYGPRNSSLTDSSLFGLLSVINLDDICSKTFPINAALPDGSTRELTVNRFSLVKDVVQDVCKEYKIDHPSVKFIATNALVSLDSNAALLENHDIVIEEALVELKDVKQVEDPRLVNLRNFVNSEEKYLESLKLAVKVYGDSLRKSSLNHLDHDIIFGRLKPIHEKTASLLTSLKEVQDNWNSNSCVASAFVNFSDILWVYDNYYSRLSESKRLLRQKCKYDSEFLLFVNEIKITAKASLGLLILLPARRVPEYKRFLTDTLEHTPDDHDDGRKIKVILEKIEQTLTHRKEDIDEAENEFRLIEIQDKFPHDDLGLDEDRGLSSQRLKAMLGRRRSAPATAIKAAFGKTSKTSLHSIDISLTIHSDPDSLSPQNKSIFVSEGVVQLTTGVSSQDRYMFLFNDFLLIAKSKSSCNYKLKYRVKVSEMWVADCIDDVAESVKSPEKSFVFGWPTENFVASFSSVEEKSKWYEAITSNIGAQKEQQEPKTVIIRILYKESDNAQSLTKLLSVGHLDDANKVVQMALDHYNIPSKESSEFQLWVLFKDGAYPLIGHEFPFAIQMSQHREFSVIDDADITPDTDALTPPSTEQVNNEGQLRFFLKRSRKLHNKVVSSRRWIRKPIPWKIHKKNSGSKSSSYDIIISTGKVFGLPLDQLTSDDELVPKPISDLLVRLFRYGPSTSGVFRKTPNQREVKELKEEIDEEKEVNLEETSVHVTAGLMKEFLRRLPDAVCCCDYYEDFLSSNDIEDQAERIQEIKRLLEKLPACNLELIKRFVCVLYHISQNSENNNMTSFNLGVCVAPSMLWPPTSVKAETPEQAKSTAPQFVEFIIDHFPEIFGDDAVDVLGNKSEIVVDVPVICENGELEPREISGETRTRSASLHHSDSNLYQVKNNEDNSGHMGTLLTVKDDRKPLSQSTPNSPTHQRKTMDKNLSPNDISRKIHSAFYHPKYSPRNVKRSLDQTTTNSDTSLSRKLDDVPGNKRPIILTSSTTSAELIEHIPDENGNPKRKSASTSCLTAGNGPEPAVLRKTLLPKREGILQFASSQSFYTAPSCVAERAHCVDRRRQPAAPSYQEHMQRQRPSLRLQIPSSTPRTSNQNEVPTGNKSTETKIGLALTPSSEKMREALTADPYLFMRLSPGSSHVSPVSSELSAPSKPSTGSETSISSLSSNDECLDTEITSATEDKPDVTQLKSIRDLLDVSGYANPLRISPETKDMINRTRGEWGHQINDDCADMDDFQRMTMAEETYV